MWIFLLLLGLDLAKPRVLVLGLALALGGANLEGATFASATLLGKDVLGLGCRVPMGSMKASLCTSKTKRSSENILQHTYVKTLIY